MTLQTWVAAGSVATGLILAILAIYRLRPESTKIFVDSAKVSVELADSDREKLRTTVAERDAEILRLRTALTHCEDERERLEGGSAT